VILIPQVQAILTLIERLQNPKHELSLEKQIQLGNWLQEYVYLHDSKLINESFIKIEPEQKVEPLPFA
jgi:hypothetical protein